MSDRQYRFYECDNPDCALRFPGYEGYPRWNRCPVCRSKTHVVVVSDQPSASETKVDYRIGSQLEGLLDNIRSAWNVGSIFRTADGIGIRKLYLCGITPTPANPKLGKTSLGAEQNLAWESSRNSIQTAIQLKSQGHSLWALEDMPGAVPLYQVDTSEMSRPLVLVVGNEVAGVDPGLLALCDQVVTIPMQGMKHSYNVAIAFSIAASFLYYRQSVSHASRRMLPNT